MSRYGTKLSRYATTQCQCLLAAIELRTQQLEVNEQTLLILYNFRMFGYHAHIRSVTITYVIYQ